MMKIYKNGELVVTTNTVRTFRIDPDTDVVSFGGGSASGRKGSPDWRIELDPNEVGILHHKLDQRRAKVRAAYEALTPQQRGHYGALLLTSPDQGLGAQEKLIARIKREESQS
jgi:hypothetical protein